MAAHFSCQIGKRLYIAVIKMSGATHLVFSQQEASKAFAAIVTRLLRVNIHLDDLISHKYNNI